MSWKDTVKKDEEDEYDSPVYPSPPPLNDIESIVSYIDEILINLLNVFDYDSNRQQVKNVLKSVQHALKKLGDLE